MDKHQDNLGYLMNKTTKMLRAEFNNNLKKHKLTTSQWAVIRDIYAQELMGKEAKDTTPAAVAQRLFADRPTISGIVERLLKNGWIETKVNPADRRSNFISLTNKSRELMTQLEKLGDDVVGQAIAGFTDEELDKFKSFLKRIIENLSIQN